MSIHAARWLGKGRLHSERGLDGDRSWLSGGGGGVGAPQAVLLDEDIGEDEAADGSLLAQSTASPCRGHRLLQLPSYPPGTGARDGCG